VEAAAPPVVDIILAALNFLIEETRRTRNITIPTIRPRIAPSLSVLVSS
jgi:hypothetical protein